MNRCLRVPAEEPGPMTTDSAGLNDGRFAFSCSPGASGSRLKAGTRARR